MVEHLLAHGSLFGILFVIVFVLWIITRFIVNIPQGHIGIVERRWMGNKLPPGRVYATKGEIGIEAAFLLPGPHALLWPVRRLIKKVPFETIGPNELGYITATDGASLPPGRIYAADAAGDHHKNFEDPIGFLENGGIRGPQLRVLNSGQQVKLHPFLFTLEKRPKKKVKEGSVGHVTAHDGAALNPGEIVGKSIEGHDSFQQGEMFLLNGGQKGPQVDFLRPGGTYNINEWVFEVEEQKVVTIPEDKIGVVTAIGGAPLPAGDVVAKTPDPKVHNYFQDGQKFLDNGGIRGEQETVLPPGSYYIGPLFHVEVRDCLIVQPGTVRVVVSYIGKDPATLPAEKTDQGETADAKPHVVGSDVEDATEKRLDSGVRQLHVVPVGYRGVQNTVLGAGKYNLNPIAYSTVEVRTTTTTMEWNTGTNTQFDSFEVVSNDGYKAKIDIEFNYRIPAECAPFLISKVGSIANLEKDVIHPLVAGIVRIQVSSSPAIAYMQERAKEQESALARLREALKEYKVEAVQLLITNIVLDTDLMNTVKAKNIAELRTATLAKEREAEEANILLEQTKGRASQQARLAAAEIGIQVAEHEAAQATKKAEGEAAAIQKVGLANAAVIEATGKANGAAYTEQAKALGQSGLTAVEVLKLVASGQIKITPDNLVMGGGTNDGGGTVGGLVTLLLAQTLKGGDAVLPPPTQTA
jgi:regulator of protease activity HflC (stomatin/prohibitin superfamily)